MRGLLGTLSFFFFLKTVAMIPLANAMVLLYTFPVFAAFFSFLIFREPIGRIEIALIAIGLIGIYILINPGDQVSYNLGYVYGLLAGCFSGLAVVLIRKLRETNGPLIIYFYFCLVGGLMSFPFFIKEFRMPNLPQIVVLTGIALILLIGQILMTHGFRFCKAAEGSVIMMSEVVFAGIAGVLIFNDSLSPGFLTGAFLIIGSGVGLNLVSRRFRRSAESLEA
jgi:drug/metabolite transporter (DMT)-like permease